MECVTTHWWFNKGNMNLHPFPRTSAAITITQKELTTILKVINIAVQAVTMVYYAIMMYVSYPSLVFMIVYTVLFGVSAALFVVSFALSERKGEWKEEAKLREKKKRKVSLILKIINYVIRLGLIGVAVYDIVRGQNSGLAIASTVVSGILFLFGLVIESALRLFDHYIDFFSFALKRDYEEHRIVSGISKFKENPFGLIENITGSLAGKEKEDPRTPKEKALEEKLMATYQENKKAKDEEKALQKVERDHKRNESKKRIAENIQKIKERFRKRKDEDPES